MKETYKGKRSGLAELKLHFITHKKKRGQFVIKNDISLGEQARFRLGSQLLMRKFIDAFLHLSTSPRGPLRSSATMHRLVYPDQQPSSRGSGHDKTLANKEE